MLKYSKLNKIIVLMIIILLSFLLGCENSHYANKGTATCSLDIDLNGAGTRTIICKSPSGSIDKIVVGGKAALDSFININCPSVMSYNLIDENTYEFNVSFSDFRDYRMKMSTLVGRNTNIVFGIPDNIFAKGFCLKEDFSNRDLMSWLYDKMHDEGIIKSDKELWTFNETTINCAEKSYVSKGNINVLELEYNPIDKVALDTSKIGEGFKRSVCFYFSNKTLQEVGENVSPYMNTLIPENGNGVWGDTFEGKSFIITFSASNVEELQIKTNKVLANNFNYISESKQNSSILNLTKNLSEELNFLCFPSNKEGKTFVEYQFNFENDGAKNTVLISDYDKTGTINNEVENNTFNISKDVDILNLSISSVNEYKVNDIVVNMTETSPSIFIRNIKVYFEGNNSNKGAILTKQYIDNFSLDYVSANVDNNCCIITVGSTIEEINLALNKLFLGENYISLSSDDGFKLNNSVTVKDNIDMGNFLLSLGYSGQIKYEANFLNKIMCAEKSDSEGQIIISDINSDSFTMLINGNDKTELSIVDENINIIYVFVIIILIIAEIAVLCLILYYLFVKLKKKNKEFIITTKKCKSCGEPIYKFMKFCIKCGTPINYIDNSNFKGQYSDKNCKVCNAKTYEGMKYCIKCGALLENKNNITK